ncbi:ABC transporter ATP-binding protein [Clostridium sporogenes]
MIELKNITFHYGNKEENASVNDINLSIKQGECILFCGTSGCGKTTITRLINGLIPNYYEGILEGKVYLNGKNIIDMTLFEISLKVGSVFQNPRSQFFNVDTTSEIAFGCENHGIPKDEIKKRMEDTNKFFKLKSLMDRNIFKLSGGEKQKIACASIYATLPDIFVLDEPSANLDIKSIKDLRNILKLLKDAGKTIIIAEHRLYFLIELVDRVIYMKEGKIYREMSMKELQEIKEEDRQSMGLRTIFPERLLTFTYNNMKKTKRFLECENLNFFYKDDIGISIEKLNIPIGETVAIIGNNGAGKSTFIRCLCGLEKKCTGVVKKDGHILKAKKRMEQSYLVMQDTNHQLFTESVEEELLLGVKDRHKINLDEVLESLDLLSVRNRHPLSLSGGQKQRVAIAGALSLQKNIIVFDEPTSGLDYTQMNNVVKVINKLKEKSQIIMVVTHDLEFILKSCNYVLNIVSGKVADFYYLDKMGIYKLKQFFGKNI